MFTRIALLILSVVHSQYTHDATITWEILDTYSSDKLLSFGVFGDHYDETLWVKQETNVEFFDVSESTGSPVKTREMDAGTDCKDAWSFQFDNKLMSAHGNDVHCTCSWTANNPCPHKLLIEGSTIDFAGRYDPIPNTILPLDEVIPDVTGDIALAQPENGCETLTNPDDIAGKWCIVRRGVCYFQTKWEMCNAAGAIGTLMVNANDQAFSQMSVSAVTTPMIGVSNTLGNQIIAAIGSDITLSVGRSIGSLTPDPDYSAPDPLVEVNIYTGERFEYEMSFDTVYNVAWNDRADVMYFHGIDGSSPRITRAVDWNTKTDIGDFSIDEYGGNGIAAILYQTDKTYLVMEMVWESRVDFYDITDDPVNPVLVETIYFTPCNETVYDIQGQIIIHPSQNYLYLTPAIHYAECEDFTILAYDISNIESGVPFLGGIDIPEVDVGSTLWTMVFNYDAIAALSISSAGVSWYDFSNPLMPVPIAHMDISEVSNTYTLGVGSIQLGNSPDTWFIMDTTEEYHNIHMVKLSSKTPDYPMTACMVWELPEKYNSDRIVSWDVTYDGYLHKEMMWVKEGTDISFYDVTESMESTEVIRTVDSGSSCEESWTFGMGNKFISMHGNEAHCTCEWSTYTPCPYKILFEDPNNMVDFEGKYDVMPTNVMPLHTFADVTGEYALAEPFLACDALTNPAEISGKWCVVFRGTCLFQDKWDNCDAAGALGVVIINNVDHDFGGIWVSSITTPVVGIKLSVGQNLIDNVGAGVTITVGQTTGVDEPDPAYSGSDPLSIVNYWSSVRQNVDVNFETVLDTMYDHKRDLMFFVGVDSSDPYDTYIYDWNTKTYKGSFTLESTGQYRLLFQETGTYLTVELYWEDAVVIYNLEDPLNPALISTIPYPACSSYDWMGGIRFHPSGNYMYMLPAIHDAACDTFDMPIFDISDPANVVNTGSFATVAEVEYGADLSCMVFSEDDIVAMCLASGGIVWYDFSDPLAPTALAAADVNDISNTYSLGTFGATAGRKLGDWYISDYSERYINYHKFTLVTGGASCPQSTDYKLDGIQSTVDSVEGKVNQILDQTSGTCPDYTLTCPEPVVTCPNCPACADDTTTCPVCQNCDCPDIPACPSHTCSCPDIPDCSLECPDQVSCPDVTCPQNTECPMCPDDSDALGDVMTKLNSIETTLNGVDTNTQASANAFNEMETDSEECDDCSEDTYMVLAIMFGILFLLAAIGCIYFYNKMINGMLYAMSDGKSLVEPTTMRSEEISPIADAWSSVHDDKNKAGGETLTGM